IYVTGKNVTNSGILDLDAAAFNAAQLTNTASGEIFGFGSVAVRPANSGLIRSAGGTLQFDHGFAGDGSAQIDAGSALNLSQSTEGSQAAFLIHNGTALDSLDLGANDFTVGSDYTNANFGDGNSFNPRANVTGAGLILAAGDVAQVLTGDVNDGGTAAPELAFGSLHLGEMATRVYQVGNGGTSGPSLRGAFQTSVNGGNISDGRLSGDGLTAANIGPLAPGESGADRTVNFTATDVGALTGQTVHVLNNFGNVTNQTLTITGAVFRLAEAALPAGNHVDFGMIHVGDAAQASVTVQNAAPDDGFSEALNAAFSSATGDANGSGNFTLLAPGASSDALSVSIDVSSAGDKSGSVFFDNQCRGARGRFWSRLLRHQRRDRHTPVGEVAGRISNLADRSSGREKTRNLVWIMSFGPQEPVCLYSVRRDRHQRTRHHGPRHDRIYGPGAGEQFRSADLPFRFRRRNPQRQRRCVHARFRHHRVGRSHAAGAAQLEQRCG
ncbi:MAG: choice-of-anchor D domain-containing protein, partial [Chthoniobacteraceae bacterium]